MIVEESTKLFRAVCEGKKDVGDEPSFFLDLGYFILKFRWKLIYCWNGVATNFSVCGHVKVGPSNAEFEVLQPTSMIGRHWVCIWELLFQHQDDISLELWGQFKG